jgi:hypothetical protein
MRYEIDGNRLRLTTHYFSELENSPAVWLPLSSELAQRIIAKNDANVMSYMECRAMYRSLYTQLATPNCRHLGIRPAGHFGQCGFCDICKINHALE